MLGDVAAFTASHERSFWRSSLSFSSRRLRSREREPAPHRREARLGAGRFGRAPDGDRTRDAGRGVCVSALATSQSWRPGRRPLRWGTWRTCRAPQRLVRSDAWAKQRGHRRASSSRWRRWLEHRRATMETPLGLAEFDPPGRRADLAVGTSRPAHVGGPTSRVSRAAGPKAARANQELERTLDALCARRRRGAARPDPRQLGHDRRRPRHPNGAFLRRGRDVAKDLAPRLLLLPGNHDSTSSNGRTRAARALPAPAATLRENARPLALDGLQGERVRVLRPRDGAARPALREALDLHADASRRFADRRATWRSARWLSRLWATCSPWWRPATSDGLGVVPAELERRGELLLHQRPRASLARAGARE